MSDTNNPTPAAGEPPVPPVTPPAPASPSLDKPQTPPAAPAYPQPGYPAQGTPAPAYQAPPAGGYQAPAGGYQTPPTGGYQTPPPAQGGYAPAPPGYQPPPAQPYYNGYPPAQVGPPMNTLAIITIILAFVFSPAGIVTGHIGLKQIARTGEAGHGLAKAGLILSYVFTGLWVLIVITSIVLPLFIALMYGAAYSSY